MSEPTRYYPAGDGVVRTDPKGPLINHYYYEELKAEVERLKEQDRSQTESHRINTTMWKDQVGCLLVEVDDVNKENARLKAEVERLTAIVGADAIDREHGMCCDASAQVERLTKAGDAMAVHLAGCYRSEGYDPKNCRAIDIWNAAKEGKQ